MALWTPADLSPVPWGWYDFTSAANVTLNGSTISQITNKSAGSGPTLTQATGTKQPTLVSAGVNGLNYASFDGTDDTLNATAIWPVGALTLSAVYRSTTVGNGTTNFIIANGGSSGGATRRYLHSSGTDFGNTSLLGSNITANTWSLAVSSVSAGGVGVTQNFWGNGNTPQTGTVTSNPSNTLLCLSAYNNATFFCQSNIAEVVIVSGAISSGDREKLEGYYAHKYGITANLPSGHPYKTSAPTTGTNDGAIVIAGPSLSGTGSFTPGAITGTGSVNIATPSVSGSGSIVLPANTGAVVISSPSVSGSGSFTVVTTRPWVPSDFGAELHRWFTASNSYVDTANGNLRVFDRTGQGVSLYAAGKASWYTPGLVATDATSQLTARLFQASSVTLPDVGPNNVGAGFTNTGLCYHPGRNSLFVGDDGRPGSGLGSPQNCGVVELSLDGTTVIQNITLYDKAPISGYPNGSRSAQGVAYDSVNNTIWVAILEQSRLFEINPATGQLTGNEIGLSHQANGLAFDPAGASGAGTFWTLDGTRTIREVNRAGINLKTYAAITPNVPDQLTFDPVNRVLYATSGSNGADGEITCYRADDGAPLGTYAFLDGVVSVEGIVFVNDQLICCSDENYHNSGLNINRLVYFNAKPDPITDGVTVFWVGKVINQSATATLFGYGNATTGTGAGVNFFATSSTQLRLITNSFSGTTEQKIYNVGTTTNRTRGVWSMSYNRTTNVFTIRFNGALYGTLTGSSGVSDFLTLTGFTFGALPTTFTNPISADFSEIFGLRSAASQADIEIGEGYLAHAYSLQGSLDASHPYKNNPPTVEVPPSFGSTTLQGVQDIMQNTLYLLGYTGSINDALLSYFKGLTSSSSGSIDDLMFKRLANLGYSGTIQDKVIAYARTRGFTGSYNDSLKSIWLNGGFS